MSSRREFIALLGGAAAWPLAARAQGERVRRVGALMNLTADDVEASARVTALAQGLQQLGWTVGRNLRIDYRWGAMDADRARRYAPELVALAPDVILAVGAPAVVALQQAARPMPIVFVNIVDPVGAGLVDSLAQPGGNVTGFIAFEYVISAKWLELLKEIAPQLKRVAVLREPDIASGIGQLAVIQAAAPSFGVEVRPVVSPHPFILAWRGVRLNPAPSPVSGFPLPAKCLRPRSVGAGAAGAIFCDRKAKLVGRA